MNQIKKRIDTFWTVWNPADRNPQVKHANERKARTEMERLARENPGQEFFLMQAHAVACAPPQVIVQELTEIPF